MKNALARIAAEILSGVYEAKIEAKSRKQLRKKIVTEL